MRASAGSERIAVEQVASHGDQIGGGARNPVQSAQNFLPPRFGLGGQGRQIAGTAALTIPLRQRGDPFGIDVEIIRQMAKEIRLLIPVHPAIFLQDRPGHLVRRHIADIRQQHLAQVLDRAIIARSGRRMHPVADRRQKISQEIGLKHRVSLLSDPGCGQFLPRSPRQPHQPSVTCPVDSPTVKS